LSGRALVLGAPVSGAPVRVGVCPNTVLLCGTSSGYLGQVRVIGSRSRSQEDISVYVYVCIP